MIDKQHLPIEILVSDFPAPSKAPFESENFELKKACLEFWKKLILKAYKQCEYHQTKAAKMLGVNRTTLIAKLNITASRL